MVEWEVFQMTSHMQYFEQVRIQRKTDSSNDNMKPYPLVFFFYFYFPILILEKEPFQCWVLNKGTTGTIFLKYDAVLDWELNPGPLELDASTLPLG